MVKPVGNESNNYKTELKTERRRVEKIETKIVVELLSDFTKDSFVSKNGMKPTKENLNYLSRKSKEFMQNYGLGYLAYYFKSNLKPDCCAEDKLKQPELCNDAISMSLDIYIGKRSVINNWKPIKSVHNLENGFDANVYRKNNDIIIAYGATNDDKDVYTDVQMANGNLPNQYEDAVELYSKVKNENKDCNITVTGTSLGGSLAELVASTFEDTKAITFNAYGTAKIIENNSNEENGLKDNKNTYNYITLGDPVSTSAKHVGQTICKKPSAGIYHSISNFFGFFNNKTED